MTNFDAINSIVFNKDGLKTLYENQMGFYAELERAYIERIQATRPKGLSDKEIEYDNRVIDQLKKYHEALKIKRDGFERHFNQVMKDIDLLQPKPNDSGESK